MKAGSRRDFLKKLGLTTAASVGVATIAKSVSDNPEVENAFDSLSWEKFFQKHYKEMSEADKKIIFARIERESGAKFNKQIQLKDPAPLEGVKYAYALNLSRCNGNRLCVTACMKENNQSRNPAIQYIKVIEMPRGSFDFERGDMYYEGKEVPRKDKYYLPVQCNQCDNPPCTKACPVNATWKEKDGIVVIDYDWCIGCRYCQAACPYEARHFNYATPQIPADEVNPNQGYLSNRVRSKGVMEKCTFCLHRVREGRYPACMEACPTGARKFGNILDPESEVSQILKTKHAFVLKEELGTVPSFFYYFD